MSNLAVSVAGAPAAEKVAISATEKGRRWFELGLVLIIAVGSSIVYSIYILTNGLSQDSSMSNIRWIINAIQEAAALLLLAYVLSRRGLKLADLGLRWSLRDVGAGLLVTVVSYFAYAFGYMLVRSVQHSMFGFVAAATSAKAVFGHPSVVVILFCLLNPFFEELIVRAYLMTEVAELTGSTALGVVLSVAIQFSYHLYYGWVGAISLSFQFLTFALYYARSRRALPIVVAHGFFDVYGVLELLRS